eukprot:11479228-Heterocapsa_arctica.AAC.1
MLSLGTRYCCMAFRSNFPVHPIHRVHLVRLVRFTNHWAHALPARSLASPVEQVRAELREQAPRAHMSC